MKRIAIIMTVFNRKEKTLQCLKNIEEQSITSDIDIKIDIYLTNDGCTDGTPEAIKAQFPYVNIIEGDGTLFWNRGMYTAWQEAAKNDYDFYLWLNDDTYLRYNAIERLLVCAEDKNNKAVIIGSCCASYDESMVTYGGYDRDGSLIKDVSMEHRCVIFNGNIVLIPRYVFKEIGFNDSYYRHALGDFDYSLMVNKNGLESYIATGIFGVCDLHSNKPKWCNSKIKLLERWKAFHRPGGNGSNPSEFFYYKKKHYGVASACSSYISNYIHVLFPIFWE